MANTSKEAATKTEKLSPMKTFKSSADLENCYRFIHENNMRREALLVLKHVIDKCPPLSKSKSRSSKTKLQ